MVEKQTTDIIPLVDQFGNVTSIESLTDEINTFIEETTGRPDNFVDREVRALVTLVASATMGRMIRSEEVTAIFNSGLFPVIVRVGMCSFLFYKAMQERGLEVQIIEKELKEFIGAVAVTPEQIDEILGKNKEEEEEDDNE